MDQRRYDVLYAGELVEEGWTVIVREAFEEGRVRKPERFGDAFRGLHRPSGGACEAGGPGMGPRPEPFRDAGDQPFDLGFAGPRQHVARVGAVTGEDEESCVQVRFHGASFGDVLDATDRMFRQ